MEYNDLKDLIDEICEQEKERINKSPLADLTLADLELIDDVLKRQNYYKIMKKFHVKIINPLANLVPNNFRFSVPDENLTYRIIMNDYMKYFYNKGMSGKDVIDLVIKNKGKTR